MSKNKEYYIEEEYWDSLYERMAWERERAANEEWEQQEQLNNNKYYGNVTTQKSNSLESENKTRA